MGVCGLWRENPQEKGVREVGSAEKLQSKDVAPTNVWPQLGP